jgi:hypothetical protein
MSPVQDPHVSRNDVIIRFIKLYWHSFCPLDWCDRADYAVGEAAEIEWNPL